MYSTPTIQSNIANQNASAAEMSQALQQANKQTLSQDEDQAASQASQAADQSSKDAQAATQNAQTAKGNEFSGAKYALAKTARDTEKVRKNKQMKAKPPSNEVDSPNTAPDDTGDEGVEA